MLRSVAVAEELGKLEVLLLQDHPVGRQQGGLKA